MLELLDGLESDQPATTTRSPAPLEIGTATEAPADPALARLFPDAYTDDPEASGDFRRYTEPGLRTAKREALETTLETLGEEPGKVRAQTPSRRRPGSVPSTTPGWCWASGWASPRTSTRWSASLDEDDPRLGCSRSTTC